MMTASKTEVKEIVSAYLPRRVANGNFRQAAVLVPFVEEPSGLQVILTRRTDSVEHHKGQVSFPGGARDAEDPDLLFTALREAHEEVGIVPEQVSIWGELDQIVTVTSFEVTPFVGRVRGVRDFVINEAEVERLIQVPLGYILDESNFRVRMTEWDGVALPSPVFDWDGERVWGATARIMMNLVELIRNHGIGRTAG